MNVDEERKKRFYELVVNNKRKVRTCILCKEPYLTDVKGYCSKCSPKMKQYGKNAFGYYENITR